ncbi:MAG: carboxyvinyl-carboxyphosphonate phosphorylmutase, partial [Bradyrhizobium sp.]|nr:carboxyvinyl-carboxyphosphonate phosphorylmutase [Bradyrhizobium sp.]
MSLRSTLASAETTIAPGVYDALTASIAAEAGFKALYLTGAG